MEDSHIADLNIGGTNVNVFGVFDGHGGREVARYVKTHFTEELLQNKNFLAGKYEEAMIENFLRIDELLLESAAKAELKLEAKKSKEDEEKINGKEEKKQQMDIFKQLFDPRNQENCDIAMTTGCTASAFLMDEKYMYFTNAGDSRAVLVRKGVAYPMSEDHKPELEGEKARIYKAEGWVSEGRVKGNLNLSRSLGDMEYKQNKKLSAKDQMITAYPDVNIVEITDDCDFIIVACDGIWDCKTNQQAADFVIARLKKKVNLTKIVEDLLDDCLSADLSTNEGVGGDNMTCIIIQLKK